jgi:peptide deformylase
MTRPILRYGAPLLHGPARRVERPGPELDLLVDDMVETMHRAPGVGLAAPQVGVPLRLFVVDLSVGRAPSELVVMINPEAVERDGMQLEEEGCLSVPGFTATVARPKHILVRGLDRNFEPREVEATGLLARALQHELDHLNGCLFVDRLRNLNRRWILHRVTRLRRAGKW